MIDVGLTQYMTFSLHYLSPQQPTHKFSGTNFHQNNIYLNGNFAYYDYEQYPDTM